MRRANAMANAAPGEGRDRARSVTGDGQGKRAQRANLDEAAVPIPSNGGGVQPVQQSERLAGPVLGEQDPGQDQVAWLAGVSRLVVGGRGPCPVRNGLPRPAHPGPAAAAPAAPAPG